MEAYDTPPSGGKRKFHKTWSTGWRAGPLDSRPPDGVLAERDRAVAGAQSLTAATFGDPLPGRSALDRCR